jgi:cation:H+ antiporter
MGRSDVAVGNIIGSNIYNILGILGVTATIIPVTVPADMGWVDWGVMYGAAALLLLRAWMAKRIGRLDGAVFLAIYVAFCYYLITTGAAPTA